MRLWCDPRIRLARDSRGRGHFVRPLRKTGLCRPPFVELRVRHSRGRAEWRALVPSGAAMTAARAGPRDRLANACRTLRSRADLVRRMAAEAVASLDPDAPVLIPAPAARLFEIAKILDALAELEAAEGASP